MPKLFFKKSKKKKWNTSMEKVGSKVKGTELKVRLLCPYLVF